MNDKVIAIMGKPKDCEKCVFCGCKYSMPLSTNRKGYYCSLKEPKDITIEDFFYTDEVYLKNCPLISVDNYDKEIRDKVIEEFYERLNNKISEFVLQHKDNLDFASGISVVWNIVDEVTEQMKEVGE